ncbi:TPA: YSIRK-type signal peptide-containing protein, partial [Streptococcus suis]|nr:YSIRK-type signal peptide-containing protein [Streptococcus suis]HEM4060995.1 YSIRK-type signal peptide-containing protein [Streptococcus suis]
MKQSKSKGFNWYQASQRFSIRKYHFGAASVLLGLTMVLAGGQTVQAAENQSATGQLNTADATALQSQEESPVESVATLEASEIASSTSGVASQTEVAKSQEKASAESVASSATSVVASEVSSEVAMPTTATATENQSATEPAQSQKDTAVNEVSMVSNPSTEVKSTERTARIPYRVVYTDVETGQVFRPTQVAYETVQTDSEVAQKEISISADHIRTGYRLADGQSSTLTTTIVENQRNILSFSIVKDKQKSSETSGLNQVTALRSTGSADTISGIFVKGNESIYTGQNSDDELQLSVTGIADTYTNLTVQFEVYENGVQGQSNLVKLSGYNNAPVTYDVATKTYSLKIGQLISGSKIVLPIAYTAEK